MWRSCLFAVQRMWQSLCTPYRTGQQPLLSSQKRACVGNERRQFLTVTEEQSFDKWIVCASLCITYCDITRVGFSASVNNTADCHRGLILLILHKYIALYITMHSAPLLHPSLQHLILNIFQMDLANVDWWFNLSAQYNRMELRNQTPAATVHSNEITHHFHWHEQIFCYTDLLIFGLS